MRKNFAANHHFVELDSLRGLAAITVMLGHFLNLFRVTQGPYQNVAHAITTLDKTPLFAFYAGHESVMLFFVLSGFVLSLQFLRGKAVDYGAFAVKRVFRIYVPYLFALAAALALDTLAYDGPIAALSKWFNTPWSTPIGWASVGAHLAFLGNFKSDVFDPVLWSLVHELRISFLFPALVAVLLRLRWRANIALAFALSFIGMTATLALIKLKLDSDYFLTIHYMAMFIFGYLLARNINEIDVFCRKLAPSRRIGIAVAGFALYTFSHLLPGRLNYFADLPIAVGAVLMVITGVCSARTSAFLRLKPVKFFGDISYSLYLYHAVVLLGLVHVLYGRLPIVMILALAVGASVLVSWLSYRFIEMPAIRAGRNVAARVERKKLVISNI